MGQRSWSFLKLQKRTLIDREPCKLHWASSDLLAPHNPFSPFHPFTRVSVRFLFERINCGRPRFKLWPSVENVKLMWSLSKRGFPCQWLNAYSNRNYIVHIAIDSCYTVFSRGLNETKVIVCTSLRKLAVSTRVQISLERRKRKTRVKGEQQILNLNLFTWSLSFSWKNPTGYNEFVKSRRSLLAWFTNAVPTREKQLADKSRILVARRKSLATEQTFAPT